MHSISVDVRFGKRSRWVVRGDDDGILVESGFEYVEWCFVVLVVFGVSREMLWAERGILAVGSASPAIVFVVVMGAGRTQLIEVKNPVEEKIEERNSNAVLGLPLRGLCLEAMEAEVESLIEIVQIHQILEMRIGRL